VHTWKRVIAAALFALPLIGFATLGSAQEEAAAVAATPTVADFLPAMSDARIGLDTVWVLVTGMLVFFMNTGFAMVESGLCRAKNTVNILAKTSLFSPPRPSPSG
jgi:Amt family ammonium transporter